MKRLTVLVGFLAIGLIAALAPPGTPSEAQQNCYPTGFCIQNSAFLSYYQQRGEHNTLGYPASREFTLEGFQVQIFQRVVLQMNQGTVARLNVLDPGIMPMTRANQSIFPESDPALAAAAPQVGGANYAQQVVQFVQSVSPEQFSGQPVNFFSTFNRAVPAPPGTDPNIVTLLNLEIWGVPTSQPAADPGNAGFVYQRFQRGIMHYRNECRCTEGILIGDYFKAVISGQNLPSDLDADMRQSRFYRQYAPGQPNWIARPAELQNTDLTNAFETGTGSTTPPPAATQPPAGPTQTPTATPVGAPEISTFRVDDDTIDPNESIEVTIIARDSDGVEWIQFEGEPEENTSDNGNDNDDAPDDPGLARQEFDCDERTECAWIFNVTPTLSGDYKLRARAEDVNGNRSEWMEIDLRVREGDATATPTGTTAATATPTATSQATATPTNTPVP